MIVNPTIGRWCSCRLDPSDAVMGEDFAIVPPSQWILWELADAIRDRPCGFPVRIVRVQPNGMLHVQLRPGIEFEVAPDRCFNQFGEWDTGQ
jgi:hypothetical protein